MTQEVFIDIESMLDTTLQQWQRDFITKSMPFKPDELSIISSGRGTGKSTIHQYLQEYVATITAPNYTQISDGIVDGEQWMTIHCNNETAKWVREQNKKYVYEHPGGVRPLFDVHEKVFTLLKLTFTP